MGMIWHHYLKYVPTIKRHADQFLRIRRLARLALLPIGIGKTIGNRWVAGGETCMMAHYGCGELEYFKTILKVRRVLDSSGHVKVS